MTLCQTLSLQLQPVCGKVQVIQLTPANCIIFCVESFRGKNVVSKIEEAQRLVKSNAFGGLGVVLRKDLIKPFSWVPIQ